MKIGGCLLAVIAFFALRSYLQDTFQSTMTAATTNTTSCLKMLGNTTREEDRVTDIVGSIRNDCTRQFGQVTITFKVDRPSGSRSFGPEGIAYAYTRDLKPGETRQFKTMVHIAKNATYRFDKISAFKGRCLRHDCRGLPGKNWAAAR